FHEDLSPARRDLEVAHFADPKGPPILIATECGGEGRNFQFARRLVLFDLPWNPVLVEQRIGRLDRINRRAPVEIVYFRPADGFEASVA
ncbi:MAG: helicase-related protein, partial [Gemmatimonadota bacterium]|nr:helicase-related protein [Gemmatimonadota bacterium]